MSIIEDRGNCGNKRLGGTHSDDINCERRQRLKQTDDVVCVVHHATLDVTFVLDEYNTGGICSRHNVLWAVRQSDPRRNLNMLFGGLWLFSRNSEKSLCIISKRNLHIVTRNEILNPSGEVEVIDADKGTTIFLRFISEKNLYNPPS